MLDGDGVPLPDGCAPGVTHLGSKRDSYRTTRGELTLAEYNRAARAVALPQMAPEFRHLNDTWVKWNPEDERTAALYRREQATSRVLRERGHGLDAATIEELRG